MKISECLAKVETDKITHHRYGEAYDNIFSKFNREDKLNILEVGTQKGGTLLAWKEYFPNAKVYGVDIVDVVPEKYRVDTVTRIICDIKDWKNDIKWDIVIDDGSHYMPDIVYVISQYWVKLNVGGVIVIEDVRNPNFLDAAIVEILSEIQLGFSNFKNDGHCTIQHYNNRTSDADQSFLTVMYKDE